MSDLSFDDLVPAVAPPTAAGAVSFGDLVPQNNSVSSYFRMPLMALSGAAKGALEGAGAIGDLADAADPWPYLIPGWRNRQLPQNPLGSASLVGAGKAVGAVDRPDLQPQSGAEKLVAAAGEGLGAALPTVALGAGGVPSAIRGLMQGAGVGAGGEAGAQMFPDHPTLARLGGAILGLIGGGKTFDAGNRLAGVAAGNVSPTVEAYQNLGISPTLAGDVTGNPTLQMIQATAAKLPGGGRVNAAREAAVDQWGMALDNAAQNLGSSRTAQEAGDALQRNGTAWLNQWKAASGRAWANVDAQIPGNTPVGLTNYANTLSAVRTAMPNAPETARQLEPALNRNLLDSLISDTKTGPLTWADAKAIRSRIGAMLGQPQLVGDASYADLKQLYGSLSQDLQAAAAARGPAATQAFNDAATLTREGHGFVENVLSKFLNGDKIAPEQAAARALNTGGAGGTLLGEVRSQMPQAADELAAYKLRDMAAATPGAQNAGGTRLSPGSFLTDRSRLSPEAVNALYGANPGTAKRLADLATAADSMKGTERFLNTSNTGTHAAVQHLFTSAMTLPETLAAGYYMGGTPGAALGAFGSLVGPAIPGIVGGRLTTSPLLTRLMASLPASSAAALQPRLAYPALLRHLIP